MLFKWVPWKLFIKYLALSKGFIDPVLLLSKFNQFAQPSEVWAPIELLRAGAVLHARGLINSQVIQHNLDWVWPYWAERQFDPLDNSFIPRAFSMTQINLTHRNWTATGIPGYQEFVVVDPSGLVMPFFDSFSIDFWVILADGRVLVPSRLKNPRQRLDYNGALKIITEHNYCGIDLSSTVQPILRNGIPACRIDVRATVPVKGWLVVSLRPYNMEGISFIHRIELFNSLKAWRVEKSRMVFFERAPQYYRFSNYKSGDVFHKVQSDCRPTQKSINCTIGMATAMIGYQALPSEVCEATLYIPFEKSRKYQQVFSSDKTAAVIWEEARSGSSKFHIPYSNFEFLYNAALQTVLLHTPRESYAGPYTYKRFWFRDAAFIVNALLCAGLEDRAERIINTFFQHQQPSGYFLSQDGEWDSNGQAL
ncbi:MAG: hypothetical protein GX640_09900, partial [Fibrobacter sp.]|nr:hypothetical protein [Fibrobacter sp.]